MSLPNSSVAIKAPKLKPPLSFASNILPPTAGSAAGSAASLVGSLPPFPVIDSVDKSVVSIPKTSFPFISPTSIPFLRPAGNPITISPLIKPTNTSLKPFNLAISAPISAPIVSQSKPVSALINPLPVSAKPLFSAPFIAPFIAPVAPVHKQHLILLPPAPKNPSGRADAARKPDAAPVGHKELISLPPMPVIKGYAVPKSQIKRSTLKEPRTYSKMMMNSAEVIAQLPQARKINEQELIGIKLGSELTFIRKIFGRHVYNLTPKLVRELRLKPGDEFWGLYGKDWIEAIGSFVEWDGKKDHRLDAITVNLYQGFADLSQQVRLGDLAYAYKEKFTSDQDLMVVNGEELEDCYDYGDGSDSEGTRNKRGQKRLEFGVIQEDSQGGTCDQVLIFVKDKNVFKKLAATQKN